MIDLTGHWKSESVYDQSRDRYVGELNITQSGSFVTAVSTTGGSSWSGFFDGEILNATYMKSGASGKITLQVFENGSVLRGTWMSGEGESGIYVARRR